MSDLHSEKYLYHGKIIEFSPKECSMIAATRPEPTVLPLSRCYDAFVYVANYDKIRTFLFILSKISSVFLVIENFRSTGLKNTYKIQLYKLALYRQPLAGELLSLTTLNLSDAFQLFMFYQSTMLYFFKISFAFDSPSFVIYMDFERCDPCLM